MGIKKDYIRFFAFIPTSPLPLLLSTFSLIFTPLFDVSLILILLEYVDGVAVLVGRGV